MACTHTYTVEQEDLYPNVDIDVVDGYYQASKKDGDDERLVVLPEQRLGEDAYFYTTRLNADQLEAGRKIFYDRWNFVTGSDEDQKLYEECERELKHRRENIWSLHSHQMPSHAHSFNPPASGMPTSYSVGCSSGAHSHSPMMHCEGSHDHSAWMKPDPIWYIPAE